MAPKYLFHQVDDTAALRVSGWRYEPPYDFYDRDEGPEDATGLRDAEQRMGVDFSVRDKEGRFVGLFQVEEYSEAVAVGLGLRPDLTGRGHGLEFARGRFSP